MARASMAGQRGPSGEGLTCGGDRGVHVRLARLRDARQRRGRGRIDDVERVAVLALGPAPADEQPECAAVSLEWRERHGRAFGLFVGGRWTKSKNGDAFDVINPATTAPLARVTQAGQADVDAAVAAARKAFPGWSALSGHARARHLYALARTVQKHSRLLAVLESLDNGKSIRETRDLVIPLVARHFYHHAGWAQLVES